MPTRSPALIIHTDGGSRGNPGPAATGIVVLNSTGQPVHQFGRYLGHATNNVAEYTAVLDALDWLRQSGLDPVSLTFKLDSKLVVEQLSGHWKINDPALKLLAAQAQSLIAGHYPQTTFTYIPRAQNSAADFQVNLVLDHHLEK